MKTGNRNILRLLSLAGLTAFSTSLFAQNAAAETAKPAAITTEALFWVLLLVAIILMYVIYSMSEMIIWGVKRKMEQRKGGAGLLLLLAGTLLGSSSASAQDAAATVVAAPAYNFWTDPYMPFYLLILVEVVVIAWMALVLFNMMRPEKAVEPEVQRVSVLTAIWNKINPTLPVEREDEIKLDDHEYDGIVELGNKMPPWLQFIFYVTILFAVIYAP
ncbi:MAG TPA: cbb3-type cytochrome c oxidase N-terminal domain-containing protein, partial [Chitinophagales bacterium]|nr:cbb3-type cytochrome c oxidase N-terminal domain-containing protein [Chitinophagales bacterium]